MSKATEPETKYVIWKGRKAPPPVQEGRTQKYYLLRRHWNVFVWIAGQVIDKRRIPSYADIAGRWKFKDASGAYRAVSALKRAGLIVTNRGHRGLVVTETGEKAFEEYCSFMEKRYGRERNRTTA